MRPTPKDKSHYNFKQLIKILKSSPLNINTIFRKQIYFKISNSAIAASFSSLLTDEKAFSFKNLPLH